MTSHAFCLAVAVPPPDRESVLTQALQKLFGNLGPEHLRPFLDTGDTVYLTGTDRPAGLAILQSLLASGLNVQPDESNPPLQRLRSIVMPHPKNPDQSVIVGLCHVGTTAITETSPTAMFAMDTDLSGSHAGASCPHCRSPLLNSLAFCPSCGQDGPHEAVLTVQWQIFLPDDTRRNRILGWLAKATGHPLNTLRPEGRQPVTVSLTAPMSVVRGVEDRLSSWGAEIMPHQPSGSPPVGLIVKGSAFMFSSTALVMLIGGPPALGLTLGAAAAGAALWPQFKHLQVSTHHIRLDVALDLAGPMPVGLTTDLRAALHETTGSSLQGAVQRTLTMAMGIFQAIGTADEIGQSLWQDTVQPITAVVSGITGLVRRGQQLERYLQAHSSEALVDEQHRIERMMGRTDDPVSKANYEQALNANVLAQQRRNDITKACERLASQLLILLNGLADVQATVTLSGLHDIDHAGGAAPLVSQLHQLQRDVQAIDASLAELQVI